ncbi:MAG: LysR substrate-binding domain-containing protein [Pleurocapsa sp. MO_226.B13]|nr:LysR substrate-binding domain-containing protein [Pleurocapsa sp. MO_226.B13]
MDRLACIKSFVRTVETGSFSAVAREMNTTQPTISKQIAALEEYLDVQLLTRSTRKLNLTEAGEQFYAYSQQIIDSVAAAEASVGKRQKPSGNLRINCPVSFGHLQIVPRLKTFLARYPEIKIDLMMSDRFVDLVEEGVDLAIRIGKHRDTSLIAERIGVTRRVTIGAVSYFEQAGEPRSPQELINYNCIVYTRLSTGNEWHFQDLSGSAIIVKVQGNFKADNSVAIRQAVLTGLGIAVAPIWLFGDEINTERLKIILSEYQPITLPIYAVYRRGRFKSAKVACFINFLRDEFKLYPWVSDFGQ